jgi:hypothetical protein
MWATPMLLLLGGGGGGRPEVARRLRQEPELQRKVARIEKELSKVEI